MRKLNDNQISLSVDVSETADFGTRVMTLVISGKTYLSYGNITVEKDSGNIVAAANARANPQSFFVAETTRYALEVPVKRRLSPGDSIEYQFPNGFDVTQATFDS